jgi:uncharacterized repeat protein (TIGR03803 family)
MRTIMSPSAPTITGTAAGQKTAFEAPIDPFSGVTIGDANAGATDTLSITLSGPGSLSGTGLSGSNGNYTLTGTAAAITSELRALSFTPVNGVLNTSVTTTFTLSDTSSAYGVGAYDGSLSTLATFTGTNGRIPSGDLVSDAAGDLFGTAEGGADGDGTVFEIAKSTNEVTTLATFTGANGEYPFGGLISDATGDLFGTTSGGGADADGTVFEIAKSTGEVTTLATFTGANGADPVGGVISDAAGDLFGTTENGGADKDGTVFEIVKSTGKLTTLATFAGPNGAILQGSLTVDAAGDLFGTTVNGGADGDGTVFEIATATGELTTLATFTGADGQSPYGDLTIDAAGDLFGTTNYGGADSDGTVFEIAKATGKLTTLASFTGANGANPQPGLIIDAAGDLFGTTSFGGADRDGTMFEIAKSTGDLTTLATFTGANGEYPNGAVTLDSAGDLVGATSSGGPDLDGTVYELPATSFVPTPVIDKTTTVADSDPGSDIIWQNTTTGQASIWEMDGNALVGGGKVSPNPGTNWRAVGTDDFTGDGRFDILWQNTSTGQASIWEVNGNSLIGGGPVAPNPGLDWRAVGTGDFYGAGDSDILWQNTATGQASIWEMNGNSLIGGGKVSPNPGTNWRAVGTGDFTGAGDSDILWQNTATGQVSIWEMNGNDLIGGGAVTPNPGPSWKAVATGDFTGAGDSDIVFQNTTTGQVSIWEMSGTNIIGGGAVSANPGPNWHVIGTGAGGSDILLQNISGQTSIWDMSGATIAGGGPVTPNPGSSWRAVGLT